MITKLSPFSCSLKLNKINIFPTYCATLLENNVRIQSKTKMYSFLGVHSSRSFVACQASSITNLQNSVGIGNLRTVGTGLFSTTSFPEKIFKLGRLNHVAIAVPDLQAATAFYRSVSFKICYKKN